MKKILIVAVIVSLLFPVACSKHNDGGSSGSPITTQAQAKLMFMYIDAMWTSHLKPALTKKEQTFTNYLLVDSAGQKVTVNGSYDVSGYSGSSGSTSSTIADVTVTFVNYKADGLNISGVMRFFDSYNSRTDCGSAGCATSSHKSVSYATADTTAASAVAVSYNSGGTTVSDNIVLRASKEYTSFSVKMKNKNGQNFSFTY
jgi:hypothetical protein